MIKAEIYRLLCSKRLYLSFVLLVAAIVLCNVSDLRGGIEFIAVDYIFDWVTAFGWFREIIFVIWVWPFAISYCEDVEHGFYKSIRSRTSELNYAVIKVLVSFVGVFLMMAVALSVACAILSLFFPMYQMQLGIICDMSGAYAGLIRTDAPILFFVARIILFSLGTGVYTFFALLISTFKPDYYITISTPFIASFICKRIGAFIPSCFSIDACLSGAWIYKDWTVRDNFLYAIFFLSVMSLLVGSAFIYRLMEEQGEK